MKPWVSKILLFVVLICIQSTGAAQKITLVILQNNDSKAARKDTDSLYHSHLQYLRELSDQGNLIAAGALNDNGELLVFRSSLTLTKELIDKDPAFSSKLLLSKIYEANPVFGNFCFLPENFKFRDFFFVHFEMHYTKESVRATEKTLVEHTKHLNTIINKGNVRFLAELSGDQGEILIYDGTDLKQMLANDYAVREGFMLANTRTLTIAEEAFCK